MATASQSSTSGSNDVQLPPSRTKGCMLCRKEVAIESFNELKRGDQIAMPGRMPLIGHLYDHHAVVANIEPISDDDPDDDNVDGKTAKLTVVDVDQKGKPRILCPCNQKEYPVKEHGLYSKTKHMLVTRCVALSGPNAIALRKVVYRKRKFDLEATYQRAHNCANEYAKRHAEESAFESTDGAVQQSTDEAAPHNADPCQRKKRVLKYCFCLQNCEHFASACVNGPDPLIDESLAESLSIQSLDFFFVVISALFWALQSFFYGFNFWMYAVFVAKDPDFKFLTKQKGLRDYLERQCYQNHSSSHHFQTTCDWRMIGVFVAVFSFIFFCIILCYFVPLYRKGYLCKLCFITVGIDLFFSRLISFLLVETISIFLEDPLYRVVTKLKMSRAATILTLITVSACGAILIYSLASLVTKTIVWLCDKCSNCMKGKDFPDYVHFKGLMWCACKLRCCCKGEKKKLAVEETELSESVK